MKINLCLLHSAILIAVWIIAGGCANIQYNYIGKTKAITRANVEAINGDYQDCPTSDTSLNYANLLWGQIAPQRTYKNGRRDTIFYRKYKIPGYYQIHIEAIGSHKLVAKLFLDNNQVGRRKIIRGRIIKGCFCAQRATVLPFFPLVFGYMCHSIRIGLIDEGIFVDSKWKDWGAAFGFGGSHTNIGSATYRKMQ